MKQFHLKHLQLHSFKSHAEGRFDFLEGVNCITGPNGSGKTNILEGIHYLGFCKGYFNVMDGQNIRHGEEQFSVRGLFDVDGAENAVSCAVKKGQRKRMKRDDKEYERLADHIGLFPVVVISPYDSDLIREGSEERRRFMDMVISLDDREYLLALQRYNKALSHRNNLLKYFWENRTFDQEQLTLWDTHLQREGAVIRESRLSFFEQFEPLFRHFQMEISQGRDRADLEYRSHLDEGNIMDLLTASLEKDRRRQNTSKGIHKDDLIMTVDGHMVKRFGSQGQQKSFLIALKLAQFRFIEEKTGVRPILLLDDVFDKIDDDRVKYIVRLLDEDTFGQVFITDTSQVRLDAVMKELEREYNCIPLEHPSYATTE